MEKIQSRHDVVMRLCSDTRDNRCANHHIRDHLAGAGFRMYKVSNMKRNTVQKSKHDGSYRTHVTHNITLEESSRVSVFIPLADAKSLDFRHPDFCLGYGM